jgi:hypothetical protein
MTQGGTINRDWGRRAFSPARKRSLGAIAEALLSTEEDGTLVPARRELSERVVEEFDLLIGAGSADLRRGFVLIAWLIEWIPLVVIGAWSRASRLPLARRLAYLDGLEHARWGLLAALLVAFKIPLTIIAFEQMPELGVTGFDRPTLAARRALPVKRKEEVSV